MKTTQVILLSGFLGAGKTTLLRRILSWDADLSDTVVIVNEFGKVGIDGMHLENDGSQVIELTSGCICCTLAIDLATTLENVLDRFKPRRILIEASGVADPTAIVSVVGSDRFARSLSLARLITVLNADDWEAREVFGRLFYHQLQVAQLVLLNKIDLLDETRVSETLAEIHRTVPAATVVPTVRCRVDPETLWGNGAGASGTLIPPINFYTRPPGKTSSGVSENTSGSPVTAEHYVTCDFISSRPFRRRCLEQYIDNLPWEVFRIKGPVRFKDRSVMLNFVGGRSEWHPWPQTDESRLAFIGWHIDLEKRLSDLVNCLEGSEK